MRRRLPTSFPLIAPPVAPALFVLISSVACGNANGVFGDADSDLASIVAFSGSSAEAGLDEDQDGISNFQPDNCAGIYNPDQSDLDSDGLGDLCDRQPSIPDTTGQPAPRGIEARERFYSEVDAYSESQQSQNGNINVTMVRVCRQRDEGPFALHATNLKAGLHQGDDNLVAVVEPSLRIGFQRLSFAVPDADTFRAATGNRDAFGDFVRYWDDTDDDDTIDDGETVYGFAHWRQGNENHAGVLFGNARSLYTYPTSSLADCNPEYPEDCTEPETPAPESPDCDEQIGSPLVLDLGHDGFAPFSAPEVRFDLDGDGAKDLVGWPTSPDDALLAMDHNGDGMINDGGELFGNFTDGGAYANGFEALAAYDSNRDGAIDASDPAFDDLLLWQDKNGDGLSQVDELSKLAASSVAAISVQYMSKDETDANGNVTRQRANFAFDGGATGVVLDVWFAMNVSPISY